MSQLAVFTEGTSGDFSHSELEAMAQSCFDRAPDQTVVEPHPFDLVVSVDRPLPGVQCRRWAFHVTATLKGNDDKPWDSVFFSEKLIQ